MKKFLSVIFSMILAMTLVFAGCGKPGKGSSSGSSKPSIKLRSGAEQSLKVGEEMKIVYSLENVVLESGETNEDKVNVASSDSAVVTVDDWANATAVGIGKATVKISLKEDSSEFVEVLFTVTKTFFCHENGYKNGNIDFSDEENGSVSVTDGQSQVLVNALGQNWYFRTRIDRSGYMGGDSVGAWGVGSFLVNSANPIGDNMFWLMLGNRGGTQNQVAIRYGGWRYNGQGGQQDFPIDDKQHNIADGVYLTIARLGARHYMTADFGGDDIVKFSIEIPQYDGLNTYPGAFGQNQKYLLSEYEVYADEATVKEKLSDFQPAESVSINVIDTRLDNGESYRLSAEVLPEGTVDKSISWSLKKGLAGVTLAADGTLTVASGVSGEITVKASSAVETVFDEITFIVGNKATGTGLFNRERVFSTAQNSVAFGADGKSLTISGGDAYIPLNTTGEKWYLSFTAKNISKSGGTQIGILSAIGGYMDYTELALLYSAGAERNVSYGSLGESKLTAAYAPDGSSADAKLGLLRDGGDYYLIVDGKILKKYTDELSTTTPVIFSKGCAAEISDVAVTVDETELDKVLADPFYVGGHVARTGATYVLAQKDFGNGNSNWPPDNDYANGLKLRKSLTGNYTIEFTISDIKPMGSSYDGKILVYLRSERTTCSLQFVIKGTAANPTYAFVANLDDNTWDEHPIPQGIDMTKPIKVKIIKTSTAIEVYLNGTRVFEGESFLDNKGDWNEDTVCTPGIASFLCGVTIANPVITAN